MTTRIHTVARRLALVLAGLALVSTFAAFTLALVGGDLVIGGDWSYLTSLPYRSSAIAWAIVGALIVSRHPGNTIGWLSLTCAISISLQELIIAAVNLAAASASTASPLMVFLVWVANWIFVPYIVSLFLLPLLFPTGRPLTSRWRWLAIGLVTNGVVFAFLAMFEPTFSSSLLLLDFDNPVGFIPPGIFQVAAFVALIVMLCLFAGAVISLFVRYRRSDDVARQQMKWLLAASILAAFGLVVSSALGNAPWASFLSQMLTLGIPLSIGIAILRYRLWDIDVVIRKTLVYSVLTVSLALVYFGIVIVLQSLFGGLAGVEQSTLAVVISTLAIAALFTPLRWRIQEATDRRFYREKYDAQQVLAQFAQTARDETDLDALLAKLVRVVDETLQPEHTSVWLSDPGARKS